MSSPPLPAHHTKHIPLLDYPFLGRRFALRQLDDGKANGTALWLGAQCMSLYLADISTKLQHSGRSESKRRPRAVELGSGIGLTALALSSLGWDVLATDVSDVIAAVLRENISTNAAVMTGDPGLIEVRELDWTVPPSDWTWADHESITSPSQTCLTESSELLRPPFDLIVTSDTLYTESLCTPLLRSLHALSAQSVQSTSKGSRSPPVYICVERRDPALINRALSEAKDTWGFVVERVPQKKLTKSMEKGALVWTKDDWDGVEIWRMTLG